MTHKTITALAAFFLLILFCFIVMIHENHVRKTAHTRIEAHAKIVANALWNYNPQGSAPYLALACSSDGYESIRVLDTRGNLFQEAVGEKPGAMQQFLSNLRLIPQVALMSPIRYNNQMIGTIKADWYCNTIYFDSMALLVLLLVYAIFRLNMRLLWEKQVLETHVARRTKDLSDLNQNLHSEVERHRKSKEALLESEERYRTYFEENMAGSYIATPEGRLVTCNQEFVHIFGFKNKQEALDSHIIDIYQNADDRRQFIETLIKNKRISGYECAFRKMDGSVIHLVENASAVFDDQDRLIHIRGFLIDITEKRILESQLTQTRKMESIGRLAGGVAHDFNNMLNVIMGHAELVLDRTDPSDPTHKSLQQILKAATHSADITRQLLAFARKQTVAPQSLDVNVTVEGMLKMLYRLIGENIELVWKPAGCRLCVKIDPTQIDQILANLCVNARDAITDRGKITIKTDRVCFDRNYCEDHPNFEPGNFVLLSVSDNGSGMDKETLDNLFEPFFTTKDVGQGTGLGLSTVYGIVKQNIGFVHVISEPGQGTAFRIFLPEHEEVEPLPAPVKGREDFPMGKNETILVVEDEIAILEMLETMLQRLGYHLLTSSDPRQALELAASYAGSIHLLITDVVMPEMNGRDLSRKLTEQYPHLKTLFMSGYTADVIAHQGVLNEGVCFIQKPFSMKDIAVKVREMCEFVPGGA